jgi:hypothetical protein
MLEKGIWMRRRQDLGICGRVNCIAAAGLFGFRYAVIRIYGSGGLLCWERIGYGKQTFGIYTDRD